MDLEVLGRKVSTFRTDGGRVTKVSDELLMEILSAWEQWTGPASGFYKGLGISQKGIASIIGKAKKLKREGHFPMEEFKEIKIEQVSHPVDSGLCTIEISWDGGKRIRFALVDQLVDFLKKVA